MAVWLRKNFGSTSYESMVDQFEILLLTTGKYEDLFMVAERAEGAEVDVEVYIWLEDDTYATIFPEFEKSDRPSATQPTVLLGEDKVYERHFPVREGKALTRTG